MSRFTTRGALLGMEIRRSVTVSGDYTVSGGGLGSWLLLFRFGS
jgi:hypothetical protein